MHQIIFMESVIPKHFLLGLGLHSITGQKKPVQIANRLEHSMTYDKVTEIQTAQARKSQKLLNSAEFSFLHLQSATEDDSVLTTFWADNIEAILLVLPQKMITKSPISFDIGYALEFATESKEDTSQLYRQTIFFCFTFMN